MAKRSNTEVEISTEEKIKEAARKVFTQKGYAATRTRDIAEEAGMNLSLLNYYFRSKEKLFEIIMLEKFQKFFGILVPILMNPTTKLDTKVETIASKYIDLILDNPDLPLFVLSEVRANPEQFARIVKQQNVLRNSVFIDQIRERRPDLNPLHFLMNIMGMCVFPFVMQPILQTITDMKESEFKQIMLERKTLIPAWVKAMLRGK